ncbi:MAG: ATP-binding cassette domain-containing protein [Candidatus Latescibacteria bacterium]|nr:ATP-binding cassette domain-containing protein [Candidatus Latescibacterota bacterium]
MIRLENVSLVMNNTKILEDVSFHVNKGEFVYLLGTSGAGKSSILKLIHLDILPTSGNVWVRDMDTKQVKRSKVPYMRRSIGFIFQDYKLLKDKTAYENVAFALEVTGARDRVVKHKAMHVLNTVGMTHRHNHYPRDLSGGECQRVAIARAVVQEPFILLADEPTGNLDDTNSWAIVELLEKINHAGTAVLMATHKSEFTVKGQPRIVEINKGRSIGCTH